MHMFTVDQRYKGKIRTLKQNKKITYGYVFVPDSSCITELPDMCTEVRKSVNSHAVSFKIVLFILMLLVFVCLSLFLFALCSLLSVHREAASQSA